jgi:lysophospholipid acyltransferase (LPLAT)-like uncharacterized protein
MGSLEYKAALYDPIADLAHPEYSGQKIFVFWHEYMLCPLYLRGNCNLAMLVSQHRDAEVLGRIAYHMGFETVRGSSYRGGVAALREIIRKNGRMNLAITPDGPRGPRRTLAPGAIFLASKLGLPLVCTGMGYDRPWRMGTWDRFAIPRLGSRARIVTSPIIHVPADLGRHDLERWRLDVERLLNRLTLEAEAWAESGTAKLGEIAVRREPATRRFGPPAESLTLPAPAPPHIILPAA